MVLQVDYRLGPANLLLLQLLLPLPSMVRRLALLLPDYYQLLRRQLGAACTIFVGGWRCYPSGSATASTTPSSGDARAKILLECPTSHAMVSKWAASTAPQPRNVHEVSLESLGGQSHDTEVNMLAGHVQDVCNSSSQGGRPLAALRRAGC